MVFKIRSMKEYKDYIVIIGDIRYSKQIENRQKLQHVLERTLAKINKNNLSIVSPYTITLGDEFQAVYDEFKDIFLAILTIVNVIFPIECRFSISLGEIATDINRKQAMGMDGEAFHRARDGINYLKDEKKYIVIQTKEGIYDRLFSSVIDAVFQEIYRYKKTNRAGYILDVLKGHGTTEIAGLHHVSRANVYKNIKNWNIKETVTQIKEVEKILQGMIL